VTRRFAWFATGVGVGVLVTRRVALPGHRPVRSGMASGLATRVRRVVDDVVAEGRVEMQRREARLRAVFAAPDDAPAGTAEGRR